MVTDGGDDGLDDGGEAGGAAARPAEAPPWPTDRHPAVNGAGQIRAGRHGAARHAKSMAPEILGQAAAHAIKHDLVWYNRGQGVHRATHLDLGVLRSCAMAVVIFGIGYTTATLLIPWCCCSPLFCHHDHSMGVAAPYLNKDSVWYNTITDADDKGFRPWRCSFRETENIPLDDLVCTEGAGAEWLPYDQGAPQQALLLPRSPLYCMLLLCFFPGRHPSARDAIEGADLFPGRRCCFDTTAYAMELVKVMHIVWPPSKIGCVDKRMSEGSLLLWPLKAASWEPARAVMGTTCWSPRPTRLPQHLRAPSAELGPSCGVCAWIQHHQQPASIVCGRPTSTATVGCDF